MAESTKVPFSTTVRKSTRKIHSVSDALINTKFALSMHDERVWAGGLHVFYHIFKYLEEATTRLKLPELNKLFVNKTLYRTKAFEADLKHYLGPEWHTEPIPEAVVNYLEHLKGLERTDPRMLTAYVYHLYLGLLSGGQILAKKRKIFGDKKNEEMYIDEVTDFTNVDVAGLKQQFRDTFNGISEAWPSDVKQQFLEESNMVFVLNNSIVNTVSSQGDVLQSLCLKILFFGLLVAGAVISWKVYKQ